MKASGILSNTNHKADRSSRASANIEAGHVFSAFNLVITGISRHLLPGIEHHANACGAYGMTKTYKTTGRINRQLAAERNRAVFDRSPAFTGGRDTEMVNRHIFGDGKTIMHFHSVTCVYIWHLCAGEGISHRLAHTGEDIGLSATSSNLG